MSYLRALYKTYEEHEAQAGEVLQKKRKIRKKLNIHYCRFLIQRKRHILKW